MNLGIRVKNRRKELRLTQVQVADSLGLSQSSYQGIETGRIKSPRNMDALARVLETTPEFLQFGVGAIDNASLIGGISKHIPLLSFVQAGAWTEMQELDLDDVMYYPCPVNASDKAFALKVQGESMFPKFLEGDLIYIDPEQQWINGSYVVAKLDDENEATFKQLVIDGNKKYLKAINPDWPNKFIEINGNCTIIGKVIFTGKEL